MAFRPLVLCYHAVSDLWDDPLAVAPAAIERQLRMLLRTGFVPIRADEALANRARTMHVTFDDAYRNVGAVVPVLERLGVWSTIFACSDYAAEGRRLDVPELTHRQGAFPGELETMTWETLREVSAAGVEIGSHTASHAHLPALGDAELMRELSESRERIEDELRRPCRLLAYPYGEDDERVRTAARKAGYTTAFTLRWRDAGVCPHALPRVGVFRGDGMLRFALKASPARRPIVTALETLHRRRPAGSAGR
jgi:peptidoglycan/xylan/chitin deacetylase (PgdA/CDA1 family)